MTGKPRGTLALGESRLGARTDFAMSPSHDDDAHSVPIGTTQPTNGFAGTCTLARTRVAAPRRGSRAVGPAHREHRGRGHRPRTHVAGGAADRGIDQAYVPRTRLLHAASCRPGPEGPDGGRRKHPA